MVVTKKLSRMKKSSYTIETPLLVKKPYGTLSTSIYFYARSAEGYYADFVVLDKDLSKEKVEDIDKVKVMMTVVNGETVFER